MKPFDLQAALRGEPVVTRDGRKVLKIIHADFEGIREAYKVLAHIEGEHCFLSFYEDGRVTACAEKEDDLFMAPRTKKLWIAIEKYKHSFTEIKSYCHRASFAYDTKENLLKGIEGYMQSNFSIREIEIEV